MRTVHKFLVPFASQYAAELPPMPVRPSAPVRLAAIDPQSGQPAVWFEVETDDDPRPGRRLVAIGTGHEVPAGSSHIGSMVDGSYIWHIYELAS